MQLRKEFNIVPIDLLTYKALIGKAISLEELAKSIVTNTKHDMVSTHTNKLLTTLRNIFNIKLLSTSGSAEICCLNDYSRDEVDISDSLEEILSSEPNYYALDPIYYALDPIPITNASVVREYYGLILLPENTIVLVFQKGFFQYLVETKENFKQCLLDCLYIMYKYRDFDYGMIRELLFFNRESASEQYLRTKLSFSY